MDQSNKNELNEQGKMPANTVQKNIETVLKLEKEAVESRSTAEHLAGKVTRFAGSTKFIIFHAVFFAGWILVNTGSIPGIYSFDPFPYSFLTLVVSLEAIFLTLLVLMSQNRMTKEADKRAHLDLQINMFNEQETTLILRMVQEIAKHLGLKHEMDESVKEMSEEMDVNGVAKILEEKSSL